MLKSCKYCGRIHEATMICEQKKKAEAKRWKIKKETQAVRFRRSYTWTNKARTIKARDNYMCLCCLHEMPGTEKIYNTDELSVHHITPIEEDYNMRLDDDNLITVCRTHHEMCEDGTISRERQRQFVEERWKKMENI